MPTEPVSTAPALQDILEQVRRVEIRTNRLVDDTMVGAYLSHFKGRGMDFEELREYLPGDDIRDMDWNATFRMGRPFVKRFREERELGLILAVDLSGSMAFGSDRPKRRFAAEVASTLAFSAVRNGAKVGLLLFTDQAEHYVSPRKGRRHILRIVQDLLFFEPRHEGTDIPEALGFLHRVLHRRSLVFLVTDFLHSFGPEAHGSSRMLRELGMARVRHDLVCLHLHDPREDRLPPSGLLTLEDGETGEVLEVEAGREAVRRAYAAANATRLDHLDGALQQADIDLLRLDTSRPFAQDLQRFFELRRGRRRG